MKAAAKRVATHRVSKFALVGVLNTLADIVLLNLLRVVTNTTTQQTAKLIVLNIISASTVALMSFYLNRKYVFESRQTKNHMFIPFLAITLTGIFVVQSIVIAISLHLFEPVAQLAMDVVRYLNIPIVKNFSLNFYEANIAKLFATGASMVWNFVWYNKVIFKKR